jgi:hypothetical protein
MQQRWGGGERVEEERRGRGKERGRKGTQLEVVEKDYLLDPDKILTNRSGD